MNDFNFKSSSIAHSEELSRVSLYEARWTKITQVIYRDPNNKERTYESVERTTRGSNCDAVVVFAVINKKDDIPKLIVTAQYRPPVSKYVLELPAGLVEKDESIEMAALRELKEETGYEGKIREISPILFNDPGLTNANNRLVFVDVDGDVQCNIHPQCQLDDGEFIEVSFVSLSELLIRLCDYEKKGYALDARLVSLAYGFSMSNLYNRG